MRRAVLAVSLGGALGALLRWGLGELGGDGGGFPWTTFAINVSGSFVLALLPAVPAIRSRPLWPLFLGPGVLGGFTTLSTYAEESRALFAAGDTTLALAYLLGTLAACVAAVSLARLLTPVSAQLEFEAEGGLE